MRAYIKGNYLVVETNNAKELMLVEDIILSNKDIYTYEIKRYNANKRKYETYTRYLYRIYDDKVYVWRGIGRPLIAKLEEMGYKVKRFSHLSYTPPDFLYPYQKVAFNSAIDDFNMTGTATLQMATGSGKTEVAIAIASVMKPPVFFVSLNKFLIRQFVERCAKYGIDAGEVSGESKELKPITGVTIQTLYNAIYNITQDKELYEAYKSDTKLIDKTELDNPEKLPLDFMTKLVYSFENANLVVMDEVQHLPAFTVKQTLKYAQYSYRLGLSATPWRDDGLTNVIYAVTGLPSVKISFSQLVKLDRLVPAVIDFVLYSPPYRNYSYKFRGAGGFHKVNRMIIDDAYRYCCITKLVKRIIRLNQTPLLILVRYIAMGQILNKWLRKEGIKSAFIYSANSNTERSYILRKLANKELDCVIATTIADEGLDIPELNSMLILSGGKSSTRTYQRVGRVVRKYPGKKYGYVYDWVDLCNYYSKHSRVREKAYQAEPSWKITKEFISCPECAKFKNISAIEYINQYIDPDIEDKMTYAENIIIDIEDLID